MMPDDELNELAEDIKANGMREQVVLWKAGEQERWVVLDGRNRLEAMQRAGRPLPMDPHDPMFRRVTCDRRGPHPSMNVDPMVFVIALNIRRRHLTKGERATLIVKTFMAGANDSARLARSFNPEPGTRGGSTADPALAQLYALAKQYGIGRRTVERARAETLAAPNEPGTQTLSPSPQARPATPQPVELAVQDVVRRLQALCDDLETEGVPRRVINKAARFVFRRAWSAPLSTPVATDPPSETVS
jgi:hypothetical protein